MKFAQHTITRTENTTDKNGRVVCLYAVEGKFSKPAGVRPFLTTQAEARDWIESEIALQARRA